MCLMLYSQRGTDAVSDKRELEKCLQPRGARTQQRGICVRVGMEATGFARWFERLLAELGFRVMDRRSSGDQGQQKTDRKDAKFLLKLMREDRFPRIWIPTQENRDLRQLLWHRRRLVQMHYADR